MSAARILIVEDDFIIAQLLQELVQQLGFEVIGPTANIEDAVNIAAHRKFDIALLDINLRVGTAKPIADQLNAAGIPFLFISGYGVANLPDGHTDATLIRKPIDIELLDQAIRTKLGRSSSR